MYKYELYYLYVIFSILISQASLSIQCLRGLKFIKTFELERKDILICSEKGIFLSDPGITNIKNGYLFEKEIPEQELTFLTIRQYAEDKKYIIIAYKKIVYVFNSEGYYVNHTSIELSTSGNYYTLVPYKLDSKINEYYFIIGYLNKNNLYISFYTFNNISGQISSNDRIELTPNKVIYSIVGGFSCQIMKKNNDEKVLTCFYKNDHDISISSYNLPNFSKIEGLTKEITGVKPKFVLSVISSDSTAALVCYLKEYKYISCDKYDIINNDIIHIYPDPYKKIECNLGNILYNIMYSSLYQENFFFVVKDIIMILI